MNSKGLGDTRTPIEKHGVAFAKAYLELEEAKARHRAATDQLEKAKNGFCDAMRRIHGHAVASDVVAEIPITP